MLPSVWGTRSPQPVFGGSVCVTTASTREVRPQELAQMEQVERGLRGVEGREPATVCLAGWTPLFTKPAQAWLRLASPRLQVGTAPPGAAASGDSAALLEVPSKRPHLGSARVRRVCWVADTFQRRTRRGGSPPPPPVTWGPVHGSPATCSKHRSEAREGTETKTPCGAF